MVIRALLLVGTVLCGTACSLSSQGSVAAHPTAAAATASAPVSAPFDTQQPFSVAFRQGTGRVTVIPDDEAIQLVVSVTGLERDREYELAFTGRADSGAMIGAGNALVRTGTLQGETTITPDRFGEILVWTIHPSTFMNGTGTAHITVTQADGARQQVANSFPLRRE